MIDLQKKRDRWRKWYLKNREDVLEKKRRKRNSPEGRHKAKRYREKNAGKISEIQKKWAQTLHGRFKVLIKKCRHRKNINCSITYNDLVELWQEQEGKCAITGLTMTTDSHYANISVDRINCLKDYSRDNIRLVCWWVNMARNTLTDGEFLERCRAVTRIN